ncbi:MAG: polyprenyl synthetase family protein [Kiritimatiellae bacterium]|nr:polyprenyl synthetase family protein [Kiritimatiellia bacterium]
MVNKIKNNVDRALGRLVSRIQAPPFASLPAPYRRLIARYLQRGGKRIRPLLFVLGYLGFKSRPAFNLYTSAAALELLHAFILIHDDIIDHAAQRRGAPALHIMLNRKLNTVTGRRFTGSDLAMVIGDAIYTLAIDAFLAVRAPPARKQLALEQLTRSALFTGCGEVEELLYTLTPPERMSRRAIDRIYDRKTAHYSFAMPLAMGATLAHAPRHTAAQLFEFGLCVGRGFQIKDDVLDFGAGSTRNAKPPLADIREGKRTLPLWFAYRQCSAEERRLLDRVYRRTHNAPADILRVGAIIIRSGALASASREIERLSRQADRRLQALPIRREFRETLRSFKDAVLRLPS